MLLFTDKKDIFIFGDFAFQKRSEERNLRKEYSILVMAFILYRIYIHYGRNFKLIF